MRLLLDTHAFLWWLAGNTRLPMSARRAIEDPANDIIVSAASAWEITTKHRIGKLSEAAAVAQDVAGAIASQGFEELPTRWKTQNAPEGFLVRMATPSTVCSSPKPWREGWCWCPSTGCSTCTVCGAFGDPSVEGRIASQLSRSECLPCPLQSIAEAERPSRRAGYEFIQSLEKAML